jgi:thiol-disulfide isomerase/thioredoxin
MSRRFILAFVVTIGAWMAAATHADGERKHRVLFFTATWCQPCRAALDGPQSLTKWLSNAGWVCGESVSCHLQIIDIDKRADLAERYGVTQIPCVVVLGGENATQPVSYTSREAFAELISNRRQTEVKARWRR